MEKFQSGEHRDTVQNLESAELSGRVDSTGIGQPFPPLPPPPHTREPLLSGPQIKQALYIISSEQMADFV